MSKEDFIPDGFVPLAKWDYRSRGKGDGHSHEYKVLRIAADSGKVPAIQVGGSNRWYVREADAVAFLRCEVSDTQTSAKSKSQPAVDLQYESVCESLADIASGMGYVVQLLERLAAATENIATQPKTPHQELMQAIGSNGFHN